jgi:hypothetical protein
MSENDALKEVSHVGAQSVELPAGQVRAADGGHLVDVPFPVALRPAGLVGPRGRG